jgi:ferredoxin-NADP reductase/Na+-translocating ferredoxin:NAD+ oxidoreductase RnfD subunit
MDIIDSFLNRTTMYRLLLYYLVALVGIAALLGFLGKLPFSGTAVIVSALFITAVSYITNEIFAWAFTVVPNIESVFLTALILALIITPLKSPTDLPFLFWAAVWGQASKYIFAFKKRHLFNPAALAVLLTSLFIGQSADWWVGTSSMIIPTAIGGFLIVRKIRRWDEVVSFLVLAVATIIGIGIIQGSAPMSLLQRSIIDTPLLFLACVMLTEPLTAPPTRNLRILYGSLVGCLFAPQLHFGWFYTTPETALLIGNAFSYLVSSKERFILPLQEIRQQAPDIYDFLFGKVAAFDFRPGQYMEWTLATGESDSRGNRRYFTLASSPTEETIRLGVKFHEPASSFKKALLALHPGNRISTSQLGGDFTLPRDPKSKLVFIAGGIGITPYRSMLKYLIDTGQSRTITLFYSNSTPTDIMYRDVFDEAEQKFGLKTIYTLTDKTKVPPDWTGKVGHIDDTIIREEVPDFKERIFYLSGPQKMVEAFKKTLHDVGLPNSRIKTDYFPGF